MMPHFNKSARAKPSSNAPANSSPKAATPSPQFTKSQNSSPAGRPDQAEDTPCSSGELPPEELSEEDVPEEGLPEGLLPEKLSLDATEPFPPGLFRVPVPNAVFSTMPSVSDSALRCLLALIHLSFRFDPAEGEWTHPGGWFARSDVQDACGLSDQGTRNGLDELESTEWVRADRTGQSHQYQLTLEVPSKRFTYVPTALLEHVGQFDSSTELRVVLAVLRRTWGWTHRSTDPQSGSSETVHDRWARLSNRELAERTGRSETAVGQAAKALQGEWLGRTRLRNGPYQYRFLPEAIGDASGDSPGEQSSSCEGGANDLAPDRQKSGLPSSYKEGLARDKQKRPQKKEKPRPTGEAPTGENHAVPPGKPPESTPNPPQAGTSEEQAAPEESSPDPGFSDLPPEKRQLAEKLANVGVWAGRIAELLSRFSPERIRANFELYRRRAAEQAIRKPGAWLYKAIAEGYALPEAESSRRTAGPDLVGTLPPLEHKETVSEAKKDAYVAQGVGEERFHRCLSSGGSSEPQFMYFAPEEEGPTRRV